ncbi:MAG: hypothetical protein R3324_17465, partial [Halobacteriales archaeon]|nr:hypothetical protein [Halobacteriales archaeon]
MVVALVGIGADSTNTEPIPPVDRSRAFEYIPIPEREGPGGTVEERTYGNTKLRHRDGMVADYVERIVPSSDGPERTGTVLAEWPFHHDPNFDALTYGESTSRGAYVKKLRRLTPGDVVAFYTGLRHPDSRFTHRYLIGYFSVTDVIDFQAIQTDGETARFTDLPDGEQDRLVGRHAANAHAKRYLATGHLPSGNGLVIVDGEEPGGLLDRAIRISEHHGGGHHYL